MNNHVLNMIIHVCDMFLKRLLGLQEEPVEPTAAGRRRRSDSPEQLKHSKLPLMDSKPQWKLNNWN